MLKDSIILGGSMQKTIISVVVFSTILTCAQASTALDKNLKKIAISQFVSQANDKNSELAKIIQKNNEETADGRNPDGTITLPVVSEDLQVSLISSSSLLNPWKYAEKNVAGTSCAGYSEEATYLIMLSSKMAVHGSSEFLAIPFQVNTKRNIEAKYKNGRVIEYCGEFSEEINTAAFVFSPIVYTAEKIISVQIIIPESI
jgi:hypothetical protein